MKKLSISLIFLLIFSQNLTFGQEAKSRLIEFDYEVIIGQIPEGVSDVKIWIPYLQQTPYQIIEEAKIQADGPVEITYDKTYGNKIINYSVDSPDASSYKINISYKVRRYEFSPKLANISGADIAKDDDLSKYLKANRLVTLSPQVSQIASDIIKGKNTTMAKARALYDYVFDSVSYNKEIPGWGNGDTERVCLLKAGNCTDFHSLFISLARASGIPAKFVIGVPVPHEKGNQIKGYHCWAEFYDEKIGWIPVDISEAWKDKTKKEYYFGNVGENRIEFTKGRDIILEPKQKGEPLNYFVYPYVEVDGNKFTNFNVSFKYRDSLEDKS